MQPFAAQIEETVFQPHVFGIVEIAEHRQRQLLRHRLHLDAFDAQLDLAGGQIGIYRVFRAGHDLARHRNHPLRAHLVDRGKGRRIGLDYTLRQPVMIAQIDEQEAAVIAPPMDPTGQPGRSPDIGFLELAAGMSTIGVHG